jgi:hypothetical protein
MMDLETEALFLDHILHTAGKGEYDSEQDRLSFDSSSIVSEHLEVPYSENLLPDDDFMDVFPNHQIEPLLPGDVVEYTHPVFVKGDRRGYREVTVTVLSTGIQSWCSQTAYVFRVIPWSDESRYWSTASCTNTRMGSFDPLNVSR